MRSPHAVLTAAVACLFAGSGAASAGDTSVSTVQVAVHVSARTSLRVSAELLQFDVATPGAPATAAVDLRAGARVPSGSDIVLTVEPVRAVGGPGGAADVDAAVTFDGEGDGLVAGTLATNGPAIAGRWHGSGVRQGRVIFTLQASAAGSYAVPVRFVLSMP